MTDVWAGPGAISNSWGLALPDPAATLQQREIDRLVDFLQAKVVGQGPMNRAACIEYWGSDVGVCADLP